MKRFFLYIILVLAFISIFINPIMADTMPVKVMGLNYDTSGSLIAIHTQNYENAEPETFNSRIVRLSNPNRVYFDISNACNKLP